MLRMFPRAFSLFFLSLLPLSLSSFHLLFPSLTFFLRPKICFGSALQRLPYRCRSFLASLTWRPYTPLFSSKICFSSALQLLLPLPRPSSQASNSALSFLFSHQKFVSAQRFSAALPGVLSLASLSVTYVSYVIYVTPHKPPLVPFLPSLLPKICFGSTL